MAYTLHFQAVLIALLIVILNSVCLLVQVQLVRPRSPMVSSADDDGWKGATLGRDDLPSLSPELQHAQYLPPRFTH